MRKREVIVLLTISIISIVLISSIFFYKSFLNHKNEINRLLRVEDITKNNNKQQYTLLSEYKKDVYNNVDSKDFITDIENKQQGAEIEQGESFNNANHDDVILLAKLINSEAGDEPFEGKIAVANVVLYRLKQNKASIKDIIYASGQFDGVQTNLFSGDPSNESLSAARQALKGKKVLDNAYYFANLKLCNPSWATEKNFLCRIGDHWFFKE